MWQIGLNDFNFHIDCDFAFCEDTSKDEVCGSDGKTYLNFCEFEKAACSNEALNLTKNGPC